MKLSAFVIDGHTVDIRPAPVDRDWMDDTPEPFAYRCLPLNIANAHGWELLCSSGFSAFWKGGRELGAIDIVPDEPDRPAAVSHFGSGVLTFHVPCIFRTEPGYDLMVQGPVNRPKHGIAPLSGVVETEWSPFSFTMNWCFTKPGGLVRFEKGEPFCHVFPVKRGELEAVEPELRLLSEDLGLKDQHEYWKANRSRFNAELQQPGSEAQAEKWQRQYYRGLAADGEPAAPADHRTRLRLRPFASRR
jgi:hypothetical protein